MNNIFKKVYSAQEMHCAEGADTVEKCGMKVGYKKFRNLRMQAAGAWLLALVMMVLAVFPRHIPYYNLIQMLLCILVFLFTRPTFYADARKHIRRRRGSMDILILFSTAAAFLFSLFNTVYPEFWLSRGMLPYTYYEVAVLTVAIGLTGKILHFLREEQHLDARIARVIVSVLPGLCLVVFFLWIFFGGMHRLPYAVYSVVSILIIACPCSLGLAIPLAIVRGIGEADGCHIRIKNPLALERLDRVDVVVFDKTGTLTEGHPTVTAWLWAQSQEDHFKSVLLAAEMNSDNSLAVAITTALKEEEHIVPVRLDGYEPLKGKGVKAAYGGVVYWVGSHKLLKDYQVNLSDVLGEMLVEYESDGCSIVYFGRESELLAVIAVKDQVKAVAWGVLKELRAREVDICMLTGDGERTASSVAGSLGIMDYISDALPEDKKTYVRELQLQGKKVAMIGDGVNDSQALACADVSISMGKGTDNPHEVSMVVMKSSDLFLLPRLFGISHGTVRIMRQNSFWALVFPAVGVLIAAGVFFPVFGILLEPMTAVFIILLACVAVVLNSLK